MNFYKLRLKDFGIKRGNFCGGFRQILADFVAEFVAGNKKPLDI